MSETYGDEEIGERDERDGDDEQDEQREDARPGRLEEREQRQHAEQQHGDSFDVGARDTSGIGEDDSSVSEIPDRADGEAGESTRSDG